MQILIIFSINKYSERLTSMNSMATLNIRWREYLAQMITSIVNQLVLLYNGYYIVDNRSIDSNTYSNLYPKRSIGCFSYPIHKC